MQVTLFKQITRLPIDKKRAIWYISSINASLFIPCLCKSKHIKLTLVAFILRILSSSVVERSAVNRLVTGSNPVWGGIKEVFLLQNYYDITII